MLENYRKYLQNMGLITSERVEQHGNLHEYSAIYQGCVDLIIKHPQYDALDPLIKTMITNVLSKICRIVNGNEMYDDHYIDIANYSLLTLNFLTLGHEDDDREA